MKFFSTAVGYEVVVTESPSIFATVVPAMLHRKLVSMLLVINFDWTGHPYIITYFSYSFLALKRKV